jgi:hypothetical protein
MGLFLWGWGVGMGKKSTISRASKIVFLCMDKVLFKKQHELQLQRSVPLLFFCGFQALL